MLARKILGRRSTQPRSLTILLVTLFLTPIFISMIFNFHSLNKLQEIDAPLDVIHYGQIGDENKFNPYHPSFTMNISYYSLNPVETNLTNQIILVFTDTISSGKFKVSSKQNLSAISVNTLNQSIVLERDGEFDRWQVILNLIGSTIWGNKIPIFVSINDFNITKSSFIATYSFAKNVNDIPYYLSKIDELNIRYEEMLETGVIINTNRINIKVEIIIGLNETLKQFFLIAYLLNFSILLLLFPILHREITNWKLNIQKKIKPAISRGPLRLSLTYFVVTITTFLLSIVPATLLYILVPLVNPYRAFPIVFWMLDTIISIWIIAISISSKDNKLPYTNVAALITFISGILIFTTFEDPTIGVVSLLLSLVFLLMPWLKNQSESLIIKSKDPTNSILCRQYFSLPKRPQLLGLNILVLLLILSVLEGTAYSAVRNKQSQIGGDLFVPEEQLDLSNVDSYLEIKSAILQGSTVMEVFIINTTQLEQITIGNEWTSEADEFIDSPEYDEFVRGDLLLRPARFQEVHTIIPQGILNYTLPGIELVPKIKYESYLIVSQTGATKLNLTNYITVGYVINGDFTHPKAIINTKSRYLLDTLWKDGDPDLEVTKYALAVIIISILIIGVFETFYFHRVRSDMLKNRRRFMSRGMNFDKEIRSVLYKIQISNILYSIILAIYYFVIVSFSSTLFVSGSIRLSIPTMIIPLTILFSSFKLFKD